MTEATHDSPVMLRLERSFAAPPEAVFAAWTDPEVLRRWWAADPSWDTPLAEVDLRVGGRLRLSMRDPATDAVHTGAGTYTEVRPPERLAYTWTWEGGESESGETLVTVDFLAHGDRTTVVLTHTGFATRASRDGHVEGWTECLANLERRVFA